MPFRRAILLPLIVALTSCQRGCRDTGDAQPTGSARAVDGLRDIPADPREAVLATTVANIFERQHLLRRAVDDDISREAFDAFLERLDGRKLYLLDEHVEKLRTLASDMDDELRRGDLVLARQADALLSERHELVAKLVAELVSKPLSFDDDEWIETDADKLRYCKDEAALRERWRQTLELQVLQRVTTLEAVEEARKKRAQDKDAGADEPPAGDGEGGDDDGPSANEEIPPTLEAKEQKARQEVATSYEARFKRYRDRDPLEPAERFINAIATVYDPHTSYLPPAEQQNFDIQMTGSLEGIGALLGVKDHLVEVRELVPGGASWRQGKLEAGDLILAVTPDQGKTVDITDMSLDRVVSLIRGPKNTKVTLRVQKPDGSIQEIAIVRDVIIVEASYARGAVTRLSPDQPALGYINLPSFYGNTRRTPGADGERNASDDLRQLLSLFEQRKLGGVIVDLRGNGGGLLAHAVNMTGHFIDQGPVVSVRGAEGKAEVYGDEDPTISFTGDVVVLVDRFSASASEIFAGALQDYHRAVIVGTGPTHGKGTVQNLVELDRLGTSASPLGVIKVTTDQYFLVDGESTQSRGVLPDVVLPDPAGSIESGERFLDHAIPWSGIAPQRYAIWKSSWDTKALAEKSRERVRGDAFFKAIDERNELLNKRKDETKLPLSRTAWLERRARDERDLDALRSALDDEKKRFAVDPIEYGEDAPDSQDPRIGKQLERWRNELGRDPWVEEGLRVLADMVEKR